MDLDKAAFNLMAGYTYEEGMFSKRILLMEQDVTALSGLSAGVIC